MPILAPEPIVVPQKTYTKYRCKSLSISALTMNGEVSAIALMVPYSDDGFEDESMSRILEFRDIMGSIAQGDIVIQQCFAAIMNALQVKINEPESEIPE